MEQIYIVASGRLVDGSGNMEEVYQVEKTVSNLGVKAVELVVDPLSAGWNTPVMNNHFRTGCAPLEALSNARELIISKKAQAVVISGDEPLKTGYERLERHNLMAIYGPDYPLTDAYTDLARAFMAMNQIDEDEFKHLAHLLFKNYLKTFSRSKNYALPGSDWYQPITDLFRGVDCANPLVDFSGRLVLCNGDTADACNISTSDRVELLGVGLGFCGPGPEHIQDIAAYRHLQQAFRTACEQAGKDFSALFLAKKALLEAYTCFPVVPLAFLLVSGIAASPAEIPEILQHHEITITGGINLARAPWNNCAINALVELCSLLRMGISSLGAVHGNGGLGCRQGVAILGHEGCEAN